MEEEWEGPSGLPISRSRAAEPVTCAPGAPLWLLSEGTMIGYGILFCLSDFEICSMSFYLIVLLFVTFAVD